MQRSSELSENSMRKIYEMATQRTSAPSFCIVTGELVNLALSTSEYEATRMYQVTPSGIRPLDEAPDVAF